MSSSFSSVAPQRTYILTDLFVSVKHRKKDAGGALLEHAQQFAIEKGTKGINLETESDNPVQILYERLSGKKDTEVFHYTWEIK